jgi:hypothetical protein
VRLLERMFFAAVGAALPLDALFSLSSFGWGLLYSLLSFGGKLVCEHLIVVVVVVGVVVVVIVTIKIFYFENRFVVLDRTMFETIFSPSVLRWWRAASSVF